MICRNPFMAGTIPFGCGQCLPCRINRRRQWAWRQFFESLMHKENSFVTLTYSDEFLPKDGGLEPRELQLFIKRLRKRISPRKIRFYACGEYGDKNARPHYHLSLFGLSGYSVVSCGDERMSGAQAITGAWAKDGRAIGAVDIKPFEVGTAQYVAGYIADKLKKDKDDRLVGLRPEFARMSNRPGIGGDAMRLLADQLVKDGHGMALIEETGDVPGTLKLGKREIPLSRFLIRKLREAVGFTDEYVREVKAKVSYDRSIELQTLFQTALDNAHVGSFKEVYLTEVHQKILNAEARVMFRPQKGKL